MIQVYIHRSVHCSYPHKYIDSLWLMWLLLVNTVCHIYHSGYEGINLWYRFILYSRVIVWLRTPIIYEVKIFITSCIKNLRDNSVSNSPQVRKLKSHWNSAEEPSSSWDIEGDAQSKNVSCVFAAYLSGRAGLFQLAHLKFQGCFNSYFTRS